MIRRVVSLCLAVWGVAAQAQRVSAAAPSTASAKQGGVATGSASSDSSNKQLGTLIGVVADSLHGTPLTGALVTVVELPRRSVMTSASGAFRIDSLPPGKYTLDLQHPVIDSLGIQLRSDTLVVSAGHTETAFLSVPPPGRIATSICSPLQQRLGPAALVGQVLDADNGTPVSGAEVSVVWLETQVSVQTGVHTTPQLRKGKVAPDGTFHVCGLPETLNGTVQASFGDARTGEIALTTRDEPLALRVLRLQVSPQTVIAGTPVTASQSSTAGSGGSASTASQEARAVAPLQTGQAVVTGRVTNKGGVPVAGAVVGIQGSSTKGTSAKDGSFTLSGVPAGTQLVLVRLVGYDPVQMPLDITTHGPNTVTVRLGDYHPQLAPVAVNAKVSPTELDRTGFPHRRKSGLGHYVTEDDIEREQPIFTSDALREIMGLHVLGSGANVSVTTSRGDGCVRYLIDRNSIDPSDGLSIDELVRPADIVGIEFYQPSEIPAELSTGANSGCALLVVWTRSSLQKSKTN